MLAVACGARGANASSITRESRDALEKFSRIKQERGEYKTKEEEDALHSKSCKWSLFEVKSKDNKWRPAVVNASVEDILCVCVCIYAVGEYMFTEWRLWNRVWIFKRKSPWLVFFPFCFFSTTRIFAFFQNNPPTVNVVCSCFCWGCFLLEEGGCIQS